MKPSRRPQLPIAPIVMASFAAMLVASGCQTSTKDGDANYASFTAGRQLSHTMFPIPAKPGEPDATWDHLLATAKEQKIPTTVLHRDAKRLEFDADISHWPLLVAVVGPARPQGPLPIRIVYEVGALSDHGDFSFASARSFDMGLWNVDRDINIASRAASIASELVMMSSDF